MSSLSHLTVSQKTVIETLRANRSEESPFIGSAVFGPNRISHDLDIFCASAKTLIEVVDRDCELLALNGFRFSLQEKADQYVSIGITPPVSDAIKRPKTVKVDWIAAGMRQRFAPTSDDIFGYKSHRLDILVKKLEGIVQDTGLQYITSYEDLVAERTIPFSAIFCAAAGMDGYPTIGDLLRRIKEKQKEYAFSGDREEAIKAIHLGYFISYIEPLLSEFSPALTGCALVDSDGEILSPFKNRPERSRIVPSTFVGLKLNQKINWNRKNPTRYVTSRAQISHLKDAALS